jgi:predicted nucleotidyltransferase
MMEQEEVIAKLKAHETESKHRGVQHVYLLGSTARGEPRQDSNVDLFFHYSKGKFGLFQLKEVKEVAARMLGHKTDVMTRDSLRKTLRKRIEAAAPQVF